MRLLKKLGAGLRATPLALVFLLPMQASQALPCRLTCIGSACELLDCRDGNCTSEQLTLPREPANCDKNQELTTKAGTVALWYVRNNFVVGKVLQPKQKIADLVADATNSCTAQRMLACLTESQRTQVAGISPMGQAQQAPEPSGAAFGLPFDDVIQPAAGLAMQAWAAAMGDGELNVVDVSTRQTVARVPVKAGRAQLPPEALREGQRYHYQWLTGAGTVNGAFTVARSGTVARAERAMASAMADESLQPKSPEMIRAQKLAAVGLRWDAQRLLQQLEETQP